MTHGDPRGPHIIPFPSLADRRARRRQSGAGPITSERPWPFNCFEPKPATLPPVAATRFPGVRLPPDDTFRFREQAELNDIFGVPRPNTLETEIENAIDRYARTHPNVTLGQIILALVSICKDLAAALKLPSR